MEFRHALKNELNEILTLYKEAIGRPFCVWNEEYPTINELNEDFKTNNLYVLVDKDKVISAISIVYENEMDHFMEWKIKDNYIETARLVVSNDYHGKGIAFIMMNNIIALCKTNNIKAIHLSCQCKNVPAIKTYKKIGFNFITTKFMYGYDYFLCEYIVEI